MAGVGFFRFLLEQASTYGSRSTALKPLGWLVAMLLPATIATFMYKAPGWLLLTLGSLTVLSVFFYLGSYLYLLFKDRDALRSERYSLQKFAIEKGLYGDSLVGIIDNIDPRKLITSEKAEGQRGSE